MTIGKIKKVPLREIWGREAKDFTTWLENNTDQLGEVLGLSLVVQEREKKVGDFLVDLLAEDNNGNKVVIECQLEKTDHDHLGKILVYLTNLEAKSAVWICQEPRPEHVKAVNWLNEFAPEDIAFYLVQVETIQIENSPPAPLFTVVCAPSEETKQIGEEKEEFAERHRKRKEFWTQLLDKAKSRSKLFLSISPGKENWISAGAGKTGLSYNYWLTKHSAGVELLIDRGKDSEEINRRVFHSLQANKEKIESDFGGILTWDCKEGVRKCAIRWALDEGGISDEDKWDYIQNKLIDAMARLEKALRDYIPKVS